VSNDYLFYLFVGRICTYVAFVRWLIKEKSSRIEFSTFLTAVKVSGVEADLDEIECMLANLIDKGLMKGYMSHEKSTLVLSNKDPFPPATTVIL
jgi:replication initiation and membrane attachment protein DnaB